MHLPDDVLQLRSTLPDYDPRRAHDPTIDPAMPGLDGLEFVSTGAAPGCDECHLGDLQDASDGPMRVDAATEPTWGVLLGGYIVECDACHSLTPGDRHPAHGIDTTTGEILHLAVCTDCFYRLNDLHPDR